MASNNANPVNNIERYWEAIDLITKALSHQDGPFSWEGKHFTHRHVNIWPRPWQEPHPRMWAATGDPDTARRGRPSRHGQRAGAARGRGDAARVCGVSPGARGGRPAHGHDRQLRLCGASSTSATRDEEGVRVGSQLLWFLNTSLKSAPQYSKFLPGAVPPHFAPQVYRTAPAPAAPGGGSGAMARRRRRPSNRSRRRRGTLGTLIGITAEQAMARGILFAGSPDTVYEQIMSFYKEVGGFGHLIMVGRSGFMTHAEAEKGIRLFAGEVLPRLREIAPVVIG